MGGWGTSVGAVRTWGGMGPCWWGASGRREGTGVGHEATPEGLWGGWEVSMEGGTWGGRHVQWAWHAAGWTHVLARLPTGLESALQEVNSRVRMYLRDHRNVGGVAWIRVRERRGWGLGARVRP